MPVKFILWRLDQHPSRMDRDIEIIIEDESLEEAEKVAREHIGYTNIQDTDESHEDYVIYYCVDNYAYELRREEK